MYKGWPHWIRNLLDWNIYTAKDIRISTYITSIYVIFIIPRSMHVTNYVHITSMYIMFIKSTSKIMFTQKYPATYSRSYLSRWFSSCVASRTSLLSLARSRYKRTARQHDNIDPWQTYKCQLLFVWCSFDQLFLFPTNFGISAAASSYCWISRKPWGTHKHSTHTELSLQVA